MGTFFSCRSGRLSSFAVAILFLMIMSSSGLAMEIPLDHNGLPQWSQKIFTDFPIRIELNDIQELDRMLARVEIRSFNREQVSLIPDGPFGRRVIFEPRINESEARDLERAGIGFERLPDLEKMARQDAEKVWAEQAARGGKDLEFGDRGIWHTHTQIGAILDQAQADHPTLARTFNWGSSVQGRELWGIVISADVGNESAEPEIRLSTTMHGDEVVGVEMYLFLVDYLTDNYGQPGYDDVTYLVDNYEIHIMPLHNPDGNYLHQRYNANGVDLNRNFPEPAGTHGYQEIENIHFMNDANSQNYVISMNGHGGALVMNYPWDYTYDLTPDNEALINLAEEYSFYNEPMWNGNWYHGITNGAAWYVITGGLQDWSYDQTDCIDITAELSNTKWPPASQIEGFWEDNRESLMHYIKAARYGVNGVVTSSATGYALEATITVTGNSKSVHCDSDFGDYYKLLPTGTWSITYEAAGYISQTITGVSTTWGTPTVLDVQLSPFASGTVSGIVTGAGAPVTATIAVSTYPGGEYVTTVYSNAGTGGSYTTDLFYGDYTFDVSCEGYMSEERQVTVESSSQVENFLLMASQEIVLFGDDFESGTGGWIGDWDLTTETFHSSSHSMTDSPGGDYSNYATMICTMADPVNLSTLLEPVLTFWARWEIESDWDCTRLQVSVDGGGWTDVATAYTVDGSGQGEQPYGAPVFEGNQYSWVENTVDLAGWNSSSVKFRFILETDSSQQRDGFYFDDFEIVGFNVTTDVSETPQAVTRLVGNWPNPFNPVTTISFNLAADGPVKLSVYDTAGRLVRTLLAENRPAGAHSVVWNGRGTGGEMMGSGIYFARLVAEKVVQSRKLVLIK